MRIIFEKLQTSNENVYVDFGDGTWQSFPVNDAKANGIIIPDTCSDYSKIRIKGSTTVLPNMDVITGIKSIEGQEYYSVPLSLSADYGNLYISSYDMFWNSSTDLYVYYNNEYYEIGASSQPLRGPDLKCECTKLRTEVLPIKMEFNIVDGQVSSSDDPENLVNILTYEKGVGGTASIKGVSISYQVNYKTDNPDFDDDHDYSSYRWDSPDIDISNYGEQYLYITEDGYSMSDNMSDRLRKSLLENGPVDVYAKLADGQYYKMPIKLDW